MDLPAVYPDDASAQHDGRAGPVITEAYRARLRQMYGDSFVLLPDLASELQIDRSQLRRFVARMGLSILHLDAPAGLRVTSKRHPALSGADADAVRAVHEQQRARTLPRFWYTKATAGETRAYLRPVTVYALADPRTDEVRYIGLTVDVVQRYAEHCVPTFRGKNIHRYRWIQQLRALGLKPTLTILETCATGPEALARERHFIALYRAQGAPLVNKTAGGDGIPGYTHSPEVRAKISAAQRGVKESAETRRAQSESRRGKPRSEQARASDSLASKAKWQDSEYRAKMEVAMASPEYHALQSARSKAAWDRRRAEGRATRPGKKWTPEFRAKMMTVLVGRHVSDETRAKLSRRAKDRGPETAARNAARVWTPEMRAKSSATKKVRAAERKAPLTGQSPPMPPVAHLYGAPQVTVDRSSAKLNGTAVLAE